MDIYDIIGYDRELLKKLQKGEIFIVPLQHIGSYRATMRNNAFGSDLDDVYAYCKRPDVIERIRACYTDEFEPYNNEDDVHVVLDNNIMIYAPLAEEAREDDQRFYEKFYNNPHNINEIDLNTNYLLLRFIDDIQFEDINSGEIIHLSASDLEYTERNLPIEHIDIYREHPLTIDYKVIKDLERLSDYSPEEAEEFIKNYRKNKKNIISLVENIKENAINMIDKEVSVIKLYNETMRKYFSIYDKKQLEWLDWQGEKKKKNK